MFYQSHSIWISTGITSITPKRPGDKGSGSYLFCFPGEHILLEFIENSTPTELKSIYAYKRNESIASTALFMPLARFHKT